MSLPDFSRAEYDRDVLPGEAVGVPVAQGRFPLALLYGLGAAVAGALGYALVGLTGFMVSIVAIGMGWLVARAMMTASRGVGGRAYQVAAVVLTYFSVTLGQTLDILYFVRPRLAEVPGDHLAMVLPVLLRSFFFGPFWRLQFDHFSALIGLLILFFGLRTAWQLAAGGGARRTALFGAR